MTAARTTGGLQVTTNMYNDVEVSIQNPDHLPGRPVERMINIVNPTTIPRCMPEIARRWAIPILRNGAAIRDQFEPWIPRVRASTSDDASGFRIPPDMQSAQCRRIRPLKRRSLSMLPRGGMILMSSSKTVIRPRNPPRRAIRTQSGESGASDRVRRPGGSSHPIVSMRSPSDMSRR